MDDKEKKASQEENAKGEKIELTDDDVEKAAGGLKGPSKRRMEDVPR